MIKNCRELRLFLFYIFVQFFQLAEDVYIYEKKTLCMSKGVCTEKRLYVCVTSKDQWCHSQNNWGPWHGFQRFLVPVYLWKNVEKSENRPSNIVRIEVQCHILIPGSSMYFDPNIPIYIYIHTYTCILHIHIQIHVHVHVHGASMASGSRHDSDWLHHWG